MSDGDTGSACEKSVTQDGATNKENEPCEPATCAATIDDIYDPRFAGETSRSRTVSGRAVKRKYVMSDDDHDDDDSESDSDYDNREEPAEDPESEFDPESDDSDFGSSRKSTKEKAKSKTVPNKAQVKKSPATKSAAKKGKMGSVSPVNEVTLHTKTACVNSVNKNTKHLNNHVSTVKTPTGKTSSTLKASSSFTPVVPMTSGLAKTTSQAKWRSPATSASSIRSPLTGVHNKPSPALSGPALRSPAAASGLGGVHIKSPAASGLRLGLSRNSRVKSLHSNVKVPI